MPGTEKYRNYDQKIIWGSIALAVAISGIIYHSDGAGIFLVGSVWFIAEGLADRKAYLAKSREDFQKKTDD